jgi:hypothetical protein
LSALQKICEDSSDRLIVDEVSVLVSKVLPFFRSESTELRSMAVNTINSILLVQNEAFVPIIDPFLENLFQLAHDPDEVKTSVTNFYLSTVFRLFKKSFVVH